MTETTPVGTSCHLRPHMDAWSDDKKYAQRLKPGIPAAFLEARIMRPDGTEAPHDGCSVGEIEVRGPWVAAAYYNMPEEAQKWSPDGWLRTGDMGHIDEHGYMKLVDRSKDLIKSGGEWISSRGSGKRADGASRRERSGRDRRAASEMAGAAAGRGRAE